MSPVGNTLRVRVRNFPALLSCTTVDWFQEWPQEALQSVSLRFIKELHVIEVSYCQNFENFQKKFQWMLGNTKQLFFLFSTHI